MELQVHEHLLAPAGQLLEHPEVVAAGQQLHADLVEGHRVAQPVDPGAGLGGGGHVEGEDQAVADGGHRAAHSAYLRFSSFIRRRSASGSSQALLNSAGSQLP